MEHNKIFLFFAILITIAITIGSLISFNETNIVPNIHVSDKVIHSFSYSVLAISWLLSFNFEKLKYNVLILGLVFLFGTIIEVLQGTLTTYRQADVYDMVANLIGIVLGFIVYKLFLTKN